MKITLALPLAVMLASGCLAAEDDALAPPPTKDGVLRKGGNPPAPPVTNLVSVSMTPQPLPGGHPASGIITLSGPQGNGGGSTLTSSNPAVLSVPSEFFANGLQSIGWFNAVSSPVTAPVPVTITATQTGTGIVRTVTVNVVPAIAAPVADTLAVQTARFKFVGGRGGNIEVNATSSNPNAILSVWFLPGNFEAFLLVNNGGGRYSAQRPTTSSSVPPQIFVKSNFGGVSPVFDL